jgi:putative phage-type endonuclease
MISIRPIKSRDEWLAWRKEVLTASDVGAVAGVDLYKTPLRIYAEKTTDVEVEESPIMRRGRMFEMAALGYLQEDHPDWDIHRPGTFYADVDLKLGATPDALGRCPDRGLINIQIKTVSAPVFENWDGQPPKSYLLQTVCENMLTKADEGILAVLAVSAYSAELHEFPVPRHEAAEQRICDIARDFWENVGKGLVPRPVYRLDADVIAGMWPPRPEVPTPLDLSGDNRIITVLNERELLKGAIKDAEATVKALDAEIIHKLDGATLATLPGWKITNKITHRKEYTVAAASFPRLLANRIEEAQQ